MHANDISLIPNADRSILSKTAAKHEMCTLGGAKDNVFDVGQNFPHRNMFLFRVPSQEEALRVGRRVYGMRESSNYPLIKHIGKRHGSVQFKTHAGYPVKLYQLWQHWLKAAGADLIIPKTYEAAAKFANKYRVLLDDIRVPVESDMVGGYRVEITVTACNFSVAVGNVQAQLSKEYWSACGLMITEVPTRAVIGACRRGLQEAEPVEILICKSPCTS